jgi:hypothetical protein
MIRFVEINNFSQEVDCVYKDEYYSVRDNGAVLRHTRAGKKVRPMDNQWTFGKPNDKTGYLEIASIRVHRIVATAFHGEPLTKEHVVDHIDTNKRNNRPDNLRWVTRLENVLLNPITAKRIEMICGSVEAFLADPSKFRDKFQDPNYSWMGTVSMQDAQTSLERLLLWAKNDKTPFQGALGDWIYLRTNMQDQLEEKSPEISDIMSKNINASQRNWNTPSEFPCCPIEFNGNPIIAYEKNLRSGLVFCQNDIYSALVSKSALSDDLQTIYVMSESANRKSAIKPWSLAKITYENGLFVHTSLGSFFKQDGAEKQFCISQGHEWLGGDTFDDFC